MNEVLKHSEAHITKTAYEYANVSAATWQVHFTAKTWLIVTVLILH